MQLDEITPVEGAEDWVLAAFSKRLTVGCGSFSLVLDAAQEGYVVKLTHSEADYQALVHFAGTNPHFPVVVMHAANQGKCHGASCHAVMMEHLPEVEPLEAKTIADHINRQDIGKNHPFGLLHAAENIEKGEVPGYPATLAQAIRALGEYARSKMLFVELNKCVNWGKRADGTLVVFDLAHSRCEIAL